jgi:hypothetical protein
LCSFSFAVVSVTPPLPIVERIFSTVSSLLTFQILFSSSFCLPNLSKDRR